MNITKGRPAGFEARSRIEREVYDRLDELGIGFDTIDHEPAATMDTYSGAYPFKI